MEKRRIDSGKKYWECWLVSFRFSRVLVKILLVELFGEAFRREGF